MHENRFIIQPHQLVDERRLPIRLLAPAASLTSASQSLNFPLLYHIRRESLDNSVRPSDISKPQICCVVAATASCSSAFAGPLVSAQEAQTLNDHGYGTAAASCALVPNAAPLLPSWDPMGGCVGTPAGSNTSSLESAASASCASIPWLLGSRGSSTPVPGGAVEGKGAAHLHRQSLHPLRRTRVAVLACANSHFVISSNWNQTCTVLANAGGCPKNDDTRR